MKRVCTSLLLITSVFLAMGNPVDTLKAKQVAMNFMTRRANVGQVQRDAGAKLVHVVRQYSALTLDTMNYFYIYNIGSYFVMVSADDRLEPVVAYSTENAFFDTHIADNLDWLIAEYCREADSVFAHVSSLHPILVEKWREVTKPVSSAPSQTRSVVVGPLLKTQWNQSQGYNAMCPSNNNEQAVTGCVATAMAQLIRYWRYPTVGSGYKSYNCPPYGTLSANFGATVYDYNNMPEQLSGASTTAQITAVATLLYHCGISVGMSYGPEASSASSTNVPNALHTYFNYPTCNYQNRIYYSVAAWFSMIKDELNQLRPVYYNGSGSYGGHAFICDGYDEDDYFHINWGWGGLNNGYFHLNALNPYPYDFNTTQGAIFGVDPGQHVMTCSEEELSFICPSNSQSEAEKVKVIAHNLSNNIQISVSGPFRVSVDSLNFGTSATLPASGGDFFVRYEPAAVGVAETGTCTIVGGQLSETISLTGYAFVQNCSAPTNLTINQNGYDVSLNWGVAMPTHQTYNFSWGSGNVSGYGMWGVSAIEMMHRMGSEDLYPYHQKQLTKVSFYPRQQGATYKIVVYTGGSYDGVFNPGTKVVEQTIPGVTLNSWNTITLNTPVVVNAAEELWYGVYLSGGNAVQTPFVGGDYAVNKGDVNGYYYGNTINWGTFGQNRNFAVKAVFEDVDPTVSQYVIERNNNVVGSTTNTNFTNQVYVEGMYQYTVTAQWSNGCEASTSNTITVSGLVPRPPVYATADSVVCSGDLPLTWNGYTFYSAGSHEVILPTEFGYDSILTMNLTVNQPSFADTTAFACESFYWHGNTYTQTGDYTFTSVNAAGCDSVVTLHLTVGNESMSNTTVVACENYTWNGNTYTQTNTYFYYLTNASGCDSVAVLHLTIHHGTHNSATVTECDSYTWHGQTYTTSGIYLYSYTNENGCPSVDTLHLTIRYSNTGVDEQTACESFTWINGVTYTQSTNTPTYTLTNAAGCDSVVTLHLTVNHPQHGSVTVTGYDTYVWNGQTYTFSGTYTYSHTDANNCLQVDTLHLTIYYSSSSDIYETACESFSWNGETFTTSGTYERHFLDIHGADSVVTLHLTIHHGTHNSATAAECNSYTWHGQTYTTSGTYLYSYTNENGCPSVDTLHLTIHYSNTGVDEQTACESFTWINGVTYTQSTNTPTYTLTNAAGCDSVVTLHLTLHHGTHNSATVTECDSYTWHGQTYTTSGTYLYSYTNENGCPSVDTLHLTIRYSNTGVDEQTACESFTWINGVTYTSSTNTPTYMLTNAAGCDSVVTLHLTIHHGTHNSATVTECDSYTWQGQTYTTSGTYLYSYTNENGCPSVDTLHLTIRYSNTGVDEQTACESFTWINGVTYTQSTNTPTYADECGGLRQCGDASPDNSPRHAQLRDGDRLRQLYMAWPDLQHERHIPLLLHECERLPER